MTEKTHFIRVHRPFSITKQWVVARGEGGEAFTFTEYQNECGKFTLAEAVTIMDELNEMSGGLGLVIAMDAL